MSKVEKVVLLWFSVCFLFVVWGGWAMLEWLDKEWYRTPLFFTLVIAAIVVGVFGADKLDEWVHKVEDKKAMDRQAEEWGEE